MRSATVYPREPILTRSLLFAVSAMIALIVVTAVVTQKSSARQRTASTRVLITHDVLGHLDALISLVPTAQAAQRGLIVTRDAHYRDLHAGASRAVEAQILALRELTVADPPRAQRVREIGTLAGNAFGRKGEFDDPAASALQVRIAAWRQAEVAQLAGQVNEADSSFRLAFGLTVASGVLGLMALAALVFLVDRTLRLRNAVAVEVAHQREILRVTLASIGDGVITADASGRVTYLNGEAEVLTGWKAEEAAGQPIEQVFQVVHELTHQPVANSALRAFREGVMAHLSHDTVLLGRHGGERPIGDIAAPIRDLNGAVAGVVLVFRDITAERAALGLLRKLASELTAADAHKDEFLAMLAHEIRNPLAAIRNSAALLHQDEGAQQSTASAHGVISRQANHLSRLVEDLLDVSRISRGKLSLRRSRIDLRQALGPAIEACRPILLSKEQAFDIEIPSHPLWVDGDATRITQAVGNLLTNASKFTPRKGRIQLTAASDDGEITVRIRDDGVGVAAEHVSGLFDLFSQVATPQQSEQAGLGIGLHLVKKLVEMHGGSVEMHSAGIGQGSEFVLHFSLLAPEVDSAVQPSAPSPAEHAAPSLPTGARRILVVDDNLDSANSLVMLLRRQGYDLRIAHDGLEAVETALNTSPEVVLLDIGLPKLDGYQAARRIRQSPQGRHMRLIALTGWGREEDRLAAREAGFDDHIVKPVDPNLLLELLAQPGGGGVSTYAAGAIPGC